MSVAMRRLVEQLRPRLAGHERYHVGLHVAGDRLSAAQMGRSAAGLAVHAVGSVELDGPWYALNAEPRRLKQVLRDFWAAAGLHGSEVVAAMPPEQVKVFTIDYAAPQGQSDAEAITNEVKHRMKGRAGAMVVDFVPVRQPNQDERVREAVVAAAAREDVTAFLELFRRAGIHIRAVDIAGMALRRLITWSGKATGEERQNVLLISVGPTASQLMVVWGRRLMLDRTIEFSEQQLVSRVVKLLDLPEATAKRLLAEHAFASEASDLPLQFHSVLREVMSSELQKLKAEVNKTLDYAASKTRGTTVDRIVLVSNVAGYAGTAQLLSDALRRPVEPLNPLAVFPHPLSPQETAALSPQCGVAVAMGLALRGVPGL